MRYDSIREIKINGMFAFVYWYEQDSPSLYIPTFHRTCSVGWDHDIFQTQLELNIQVWAGMKWRLERCKTTIVLSIKDMKGTPELLWYVHQWTLKKGDFGKPDPNSSQHTFSIAGGKQESNFTLLSEVWKWRETANLVYIPATWEGRSKEWWSHEFKDSLRNTAEPCLKQQEKHRWAGIHQSPKALSFILHRK